jgi:hypothetical protein
MSVLQFLNQIDINKQRWDACIQASVNPKIYALSWYLDLVGPGWTALVKGDYEAVMPLPVKKKFGVPFIYQPLFAQQLGLFSPDSELSLKEFLAVIPRHYLKINVQLQPMGAEGLENLLLKRRNYVLDLGQIDELRKNFNQNTTRNVKKAKVTNSSLAHDISIKEFLQLKRSASEVQLAEDQWLLMEKLMRAISDRGLSEIIGVRENGNLESAVFFVQWKHRIYYLFSASSSKGKDLRASFRIVDDIIERNAGQGKSLDFEGSMDDNLAFFFSGFCANDENYYKKRTGML